MHWSVKRVLGVVAAAITGVTFVVLAPGSHAAPPTPLPGYSGTLRPLPFSEAGRADFGGVACPAAGSCIAIGRAEHSNTSSSLLIETQHRGTWSASDAEFAADDDVPAGLACPAIGNCVATVRSSGGAPWFRVLEQHGSTWSRRTLPIPTALRSGSPYEISQPVCPSVGLCAATAAYEDDDSHAHFGVFWRREGRWSFQQVPQPLPHASLNLVWRMHIACATSTWCVVVGLAAYNGGMPEALFADTWSSGRWTSVVLPQADPVGASLDGISCPTVGWCLAVGPSSGNVSNYWRPEIETLAAGHWRETVLPTASTERNEELASVRCVAAAACSAVGYQTIHRSYGIEPVHALVATLSGTTWTRTLQHDTRSTFGSSLASVDCSPTGHCVAVGSANGLNDEPQPVFATVTAPRLPAVTRVSLSGAGQSSATLSWTNPVGSSGSIVTLRGCVRKGFTHQFGPGTGVARFNGLVAGRPCAATVSNVSGRRQSGAVSVSASASVLRARVARSITVHGAQLPRVLVVVHGSSGSAGWRVAVSVRPDKGRTAIHHVTLDRHGHGVVTMTVDATRSVTVHATYSGAIGRLGAQSPVEQVTVRRR